MASTMRPLLTRRAVCPSFGSRIWVGSLMSLMPRSLVDCRFPNRTFLATTPVETGHPALPLTKMERASSHGIVMMGKVLMFLEDGWKKRGGNRLYLLMDPWLNSGQMFLLSEINFLFSGRKQPPTGERITRVVSANGPILRITMVLYTNSGCSGLQK